MGLFDKFKQTFTSDIKLEVEAPATANMNNPDITVKVSLLNNGQDAQTIKEIDLLLNRVNKNAPPNDGNSGLDTISRTSNTNSFILNPSQSQIVEIQLPINIGNFIAESQAIPDNPLSGMISTIAGAVGKAESVADALSGAQYDYYIKVEAIIDGKTFNPSKQIKIELFKPQDIGTGFNVHT